MKFAIEQVREYVEGWLGADSDKNNLTMNEISVMLSNAAITIQDADDGLEAYLERKKHYESN